MRRLLRTLLVLLLLTACEHKELCYHHPHTARVKVNVDWSKFDKETPTGMTVMVYPQSGGAALRHLSGTTSHAYLDLEAGLYNTIVFNQSDMEFSSVSFQGMDRYETAEVRLNNAESRWYECRSTIEKLGAQPEWVGTDCYTDALVTPEMVEITGQEIIANASRGSRVNTEFVIAEHTPLNIIHQIFVKVHFNNIYNLRSARASLNGLAEGYMFADGKATEATVTQLLESWKLTVDEEDPTKGYITTCITSMGLPSNHSGVAEDNEFVLSALLVDEKTVIDFPFSVGDKIVKRYDENNNYLLELELELWVDDPLPDVKPVDSGKGGFDAVVDDWGEEQNIDLGL